MRPALIRLRVADAGAEGLGWDLFSIPSAAGDREEQRYLLAPHRFPLQTQQSTMKGCMPAPFPQPGSSRDDPPELAPASEEGGQSEPRAQPDPKARVTEDMATPAIPPQLFDEAAQVPSPRVTGDFAGMDDAAIMLALRSGDMAAFDLLLQKYRKPIIHFMYRMVHNEAVAEELAQEVFLRVYRSRATYRAEARFSTWLYRIATNLGVNHARDTRHERSLSTVYLDEPDAETGTTPDVADATPTVEATLLRQERMAAIREHVMALPERQRVAVLMHKYE